MRLCLDYSSALAHGAGVSRYVRELAIALLDFLPADNICLFHNRQHLDRLPTTLRMLRRAEVRVGNKLWRLLLMSGATRHVAHALGDFRPDIFHGPDCVIPEMACPSVVSILDLTVLSHPQFHSAFNRLYQRFALPVMARRARRIVTISKASAQEIQTRLNIRPDKITTIYPGIDHARFKPLDRARARYQVKEAFGITGPFALAVGTREPRKNLANLIRAFLSIRADVLPELVLVGAPGWGEVLPRELQELTEFKSRIRILGYVSDDALPELYASAAVYVYPSWAEGFGFPIVEAMACGTPVVTSNVSSMPEVASDACLLAPPSDIHALATQIQKPVEDEALRRFLGERGIARARQFTWRAAARQTLDVYRDASTLSV
jgi:alpha-1,3-rhamnosyl/mannosyltransferase